MMHNKVYVFAVRLHSIRDTGDAVHRSDLASLREIIGISAARIFVRRATPVEVAGGGGVGWDIDANPWVSLRVKEGRRLPLPEGEMALPIFQNPNAMHPWYGGVCRDWDAE